MKKLTLLFISTLLVTTTLQAQTGNPTPDDEPKPILANERLSDYLNQQDERILQRHRPFYFAYGDPLSKLQLSFKTPIVLDVPLYFGYTQSMFWSLLEESKPFEDLTFNPEIFYRLSLGKMAVESLDLGIFSHSSNGKKEADSRSLNMSYVRVNFAKEGKRWLTRFGVEVAGIYDTEDNPDIYDYIGPMSFHLTFVQLFDGYIFDKQEFTLDARPGGKWADKWGRGGYQVTWSFRLGGIDLVPAFYVQYYTGYGETLLSYDKSTHAFRAGVKF